MKVVVAFILGISFVILEVLTQPQPYRVPTIQDRIIASESDRQRMKRMVSHLITALLRSAKFLKRKKNVNLYVKDGGVNEARKDFNALKPNRVMVIGPSVLGRVGDKFAHLDLSGEFPNIVIRTVKRKPLIFDKNPQQTTLRATDDIIYRKSIDGKQEWRYDHDEGRYM